jgi:nitrogen regulatory protein PII
MAGFCRAAKEAHMVFIEAVLKSFKLDDVKEALEEIGIGGMTVTEVMQTTAQARRGRSFGGGTAPLDLVPRIRIEVAAPAELAERIIEAICLHGSSGKTEDGRVVVKTIGAVVRIRTGDMDLDALC